MDSFFSDIEDGLDSFYEDIEDGFDDAVDDVGEWFDKLFGLAQTNDLDGLLSSGTHK